MKDGLRGQFKQLLSTPNLGYYGNVSIGEGRDLELHELVDAGFDAILISIGAQYNRTLGLPGEDLVGVYHANDLVYTFTGMPPFAGRQLEIGKNAVVIGVGNVMTDISCYLIRELKTDSVTVVARRGPLEVKFEKKEFERIAANLDLDDLDLQLK
jgi:ferredoxin--NADP+ reductase